MRPSCAAVVVAARAAHVAVAREARVARVVEELLALAAPSALELLGRDGWQRGQQRRRCVCAAGPAAWSGRRRRRVRSMKLLTYSVVPSGDTARPCGARPTSKRKISHAVMRIDDRDLAAGLQRDEQVDAVRVEGGRAGEARVVVVDARARSPRHCVARSMRELMARTVFWKFRLPPLRSVPRLMLSCLDGTQAARAVRRDRPARRGSWARRCPEFSKSGSSLCRSTMRTAARPCVAASSTTHFAADTGRRPAWSARRRFPRPAAAA